MVGGHLTPLEETSEFKPGTILEQYNARAVFQLTETFNPTCAFFKTPPHE